VRWVELASAPKGPGVAAAARRSVLRTSYAYGLGLLLVGKEERVDNAVLSLPSPPLRPQEAAPPPSRKANKGGGDADDSNARAGRK